MSVPMLLDEMPEGISRVDKVLKDWTMSDFEGFLGRWVVVNIYDPNQDEKMIVDVIGKFVAMGKNRIGERYFCFEGGVERNVFLHRRVVMQLLNDEDMF